MWLRIFRAPHAAGVLRAALTSRTLMTAVVLTAFPLLPVAQAPALRQPARGATPRAPAIALEPVLEVALDAQPAAPAAFDPSGAYLPLKGGRLVAVDLSSGAVRWATDLATPWAPDVDDGLLVVAADELLTALDTRTGRPSWRVPVAGGFSAAPFIENGWVVAVSRGGDVLMIRGADGYVLWTRSLGAPASARPVATATGVYVPLGDGRVVALDLTTGAPRWERALGGRPGDLLVLDDLLFAGADDKHFYSLDTDDGDVRWRQRVGGRPAGAAAVDARRVYYVALDNILWAFDRGNGGRKWHEPLPVRPSGGPLVVGDMVFVAGVAAEVLAYRADTGASAGKSSAPADLAAPPQLIPSEVPAMTSIALVTRGGVFMLVARRIEPRPTPLPYPLGVEIPLSAIAGD
jgi:outer membrane protein assembly factor BamB